MYLEFLASEELYAIHRVALGAPTQKKNSHK
jgi:hypothetical protein